jgi:hypothetical protein
MHNAPVIADRRRDRPRLLFIDSSHDDGGAARPNPEALARLNFRTAHLFGRRRSADEEVRLSQHPVADDSHHSAKRDPTIRSDVARRTVPLTHPLAIAAMLAAGVCGSTSLLIAIGRRVIHRTGDLGAVSPHWIAHHREQPTRDSR